MALDSAWRRIEFNGALCGPREFNRRLRACRLSHSPRAYARYTAAGMAAALVCGCAVGPDFAPPAPPDVAGYTAGRAPARTVASDVSGGAAQHFATGRDIPGDWWR